MSLPQVPNLRQTAQDATGTSFQWDPVASADTYPVSVDGVVVANVPANTVPLGVKITASPGPHTFGVAPVAGAQAPTTLPFTAPQVTRNPLLQPFLPSVENPNGISNWNQPRGASGREVFAALPPRTANVVSIDRNPIFMDPTAPVQPVKHNGGQQSNRCVSDTGATLFSMRVANNFVLPSSGQNDEGAGIGSDNVSLFEAGNMGRCVAGGLVTAGHGGQYGSLRDDGRAGASGASGLSTLGGTWRLGEFMDRKPVNHVMRINLRGSTDLSPVYSPSPGVHQPFRYPAYHADGYALNLADPRHYNGQVPACTMGSLLALPLGLDLESLGLQSEPGQNMARTLQLFGGLCVNDTVSSTFAFCGEVGPTEDVVSQFLAAWGYSISGHAGANAWIDDMEIVEAHLIVVDDNLPNSIGGAGVRVAPLALPLAA